MKEKQIIIVNYMGRYGSGNVHALIMAKALAEQGEDVVAVVSSYAENIGAWRELSLERLIEVDTYRNKFEFAYRSLQFYLFESKKIVCELEKEYAIKAIYNPMCTYWTYALMRRSKCMNIITCNHDPIPHSGDRKKWSFIESFKHSRVIIVHSQKFIQDVKKQYPDKEVIYMPLTRLNVYSVKNPKKVVEYDSDKVNFLFFGTISKYKGLSVLARAYELAKQECPEITLTVGGNGDFTPYEEDFDKIMEQDVTIVNRWILDEEVESFFKGDNIIMVIPYTDATQSGVALVAMEYGIPIIATNTGGLTEQIEDGVTGLIVQPTDPDELANAMIRLAQNRQLCRAMQNNIAEKMADTRDEVLAKQLIGIIQKEK